MSWDYLGLYYKSLGIKRCVHVMELAWIVLQEHGHYEVCTCHGASLDCITRAWALRGVYISWDYLGLYYKRLGIKRCVHVMELAWIVLQEHGH